MTDRPNAHDALLGATSELTYEYGITGTGVDAIAARAGVTKRTLYQHFGSKDRLVAEALGDQPRVDAAPQGRPGLGQFIGHRSGPGFKHQSRGGSSWQAVYRPGAC